MEDLSKQINEEAQAHEELLDAIPVDEQKTEEYMEKVKKHIATAVENDEPRNEKRKSKKSKAKKKTMPELDYADGKARDEVDLIEEEEKIYGADKLSPFKTSNAQVFKRNLETMSRDNMTALAHRVAARVYSSEDEQKKELLKAFFSWASTSGFSQTSTSNQGERGALSVAFEGAETVHEFHELLKKKTLSDLQSTAAQLGFKPSFDKHRLCSVLLKEYHRQSS